MDVIQIGPLALAIPALLPLLGLGAGLAVAAWYRKYRGVDAGPALWAIALAGLLAARAVFVLRQRDAYLEAPWTVLNLRDGGFDGLAGLAVAALLGAHLTRHATPLRRPLLLAAALGGAVWLGGGLLHLASQPTGAPLPTLALQRLDGTPVALSSFRGRPVVVNLWASWCGPCRREMPALQAAQLAHPEVVFVFANQGERADTVRRYLAGNRLNLAHVLVDPLKQLGIRVNVNAYPTTLFYDATGKLRMRHVGELSRASLDDKLAALQKR